MSSFRPRTAFFLDLKIPNTLGPLPDIRAPSAPVSSKNLLISETAGKWAIVTLSRSFSSNEATSGTILPRSEIIGSHRLDVNSNLRFRYTHEVETLRGGATITYQNSGQFSMGSSSSPIPLTVQGHPLRKNGTSAPRPSAMASNSWALRGSDHI